MIRCDGVTTLTRREAAPGRGKERDNACWANMKFIGPKNEEHPHGRFNCNKWMVKI
jgi:hypothetical protein